ncbi:hypothetical protein NGM10_03965 [Halorussus salilacus]|uniref:hypothetical protein n=1 Tax=Halorussus salilacus TaxID=2953750 RepID=UPI0020A0BD04|nr:hypothetical protein [Halorussus salilacus]USZ68897.1 hypothetical protein NGM10_03965 [Halorussus salilacus]
MVPLFGPVPGGLELVVILLVVVVLFGLPLALVGGGFLLYTRSKSEGMPDDEIAELRREVELLREEIRRLNDEE